MFLEIGAANKVIKSGSKFSGQSVSLYFETF